jgi:hypothetical protein
MDFNDVIKYLSKKQWFLSKEAPNLIKRLTSKLEENIEDEEKKAIKRYLKDFKEPIFFEHDLTTYSTGRIFAKYVLWPNKAILDVYIKKLIVPRKDYFFVSFDFKASQIRHLAVHYELDIVKKIINDGRDIYTVFGKECGIEERNIIKKIILLLSYGGNKTTIEREFSFDLTDNQIEKAIKLYDSWFATDGLNYSERVQLSHYIQRKEAEFLKEKMIRMVEKQNEFWCLHAFIHDDIICEIHKDHLYQINKIKKFLEKNKEIKMEVEVKTSETFQFK